TTRCGIRMAAGTGGGVFTAPHRSGGSHDTGAARSLGHPASCWTDRARLAETPRGNPAAGIAHKKTPNRAANRTRVQSDAGTAHQNTSGVGVNYLIAGHARPQASTVRLDTSATHPTGCIDCPTEIQ